MLQDLKKFVEKCIKIQKDNTVYYNFCKAPESRSAFLGRQKRKENWQRKQTKYYYSSFSLAVQHRKNIKAGLQNR
jgi:hypothetical protein